MADKTYLLINIPNTTTADYRTCLTAAGGDVVKALVKMSDVILLPNAKDDGNPTLAEMILCSHISTLVHGWGALLIADGAEFELTVDESIGSELVADGFAEEAV